MKRNTKVSTAVIRRLPRYYRHLLELQGKGVIRISSSALGKSMGLTASQIRQDLFCFGEFGQQGYGYKVDLLREEIGEILGISQGHTVVVLGAGNLGRALMENFKFASNGFQLLAAFDVGESVVGTTIGVKGAIPPLVVSAAPFIARMVETSLNEVDAGVVEAAQSMGASTLQIVWKVYLPEAKPSLILGGAISLVTILAYTAIAGTVGAGGLGDIAVRYGHQRGITSVMWVTVVFLIILVQVVQLIFNWLSRRIDKRLDQPSGAKKSGPLDLLARFAHTK